jgi:hypothetical protein
MKRLLLLAALLVGALVACLPPQDRDNAVLALEPKQSYTDIVFGAGSSDALEVTLEVYAVAPRVNDSKCKIVGAHLECALGTVPSGRRYVLPASGAGLTARVTYKRSDGSQYQIIKP